MVGERLGQGYERGAVMNESPDIIDDVNYRWRRIRL